VDEAIEMYQELHKWDDAIIVAEAKVMVISWLFSVTVFTEVY